MGRHAIELALDLARMPALAAGPAELPIPPNIMEVMQIAAASPKACQEAAAATGEPMAVLVEVARFYLQQSLFRPNADSYRVLGLRPGASRGTARSHMRWLMLWLHPDRNGDLEAVYAERVLKAWREISISDGPKVAYPRVSPRMDRTPLAHRLPWIKRPAGRRNGSRASPKWILALGLTITLFVLSLTLYSVGPEQMFAMLRSP